MNDAIEIEIFRRTRMTCLEHLRFEIIETTPTCVVMPPLRQRNTCPTCLIKFSSHNNRLWHQFVHVKDYSGFLNDKASINLPAFKFCISCPFSMCTAKFADIIDAKLHYMMAHQSCNLLCCGQRFSDYSIALAHFEGAAAWENGHYLSPCFLCDCHQKVWPTREEYMAHLQGREQKCPDPACRSLFKHNEQAISHFFNVHYGQYCCQTCHRKFNQFEVMERHIVVGSCMINQKRPFIPAVACQCGHQFTYCVYQRDFLLRTLPGLREALAHILREAPFNGQEPDVCDIYRTMIRVVADVNQRLLHEKLTNYQRMDSLEHSELKPEEVSKLLLGVVEYFWNMM